MKRWLLLGMAGLGLLLAAGPAAADVTAPILHSFEGGAGGCKPYGDLLEGGDGFLYGTTSLGGAGITNPAGTVYRVTPGGAFTRLHTFDFQVTGDQPLAGLVRRSNDGALLGTTRGSGSFNGSVFRIGDDGGDFVNLHTFMGFFGGADGGHPEAPLVEAEDGNLYGTTAHGGDHNIGTIYRIEPDGDYAIVHSFSGALQPAADGAVPLGGLTRGSDGALYGTTSGGGSAFHGTVFRFTPGASGVETLHTFSGSDGSQPTAELAKGFDGAFYGVTGLGGANNAGTVFRIREDGAFASIHSFSYVGAGGYGPVGLGASGDGNLYGATYSGGNGVGTIFRIRWNGTFRSLYAFPLLGPGGQGPQGAPMQASDGNLYGTTFAGGTASCGVVYRIDGVPVPEPGGAATASSACLALAVLAGRIRSQRLRAPMPSDPSPAPR